MATNPHGILTTGQQLANLHQMVVGLQKDLIETRQAIPTEASLKPAMLAVYEAECGRLEKLRGDAVRVLNLLVEKGVVTQAELNQAVGCGESSTSTPSRPLSVNRQCAIDNSPPSTSTPITTEAGVGSMPDKVTDPVSDAMPDEFDDVIREGSGGIFVTSAKARRAMADLAHDHGLTFWHNPGGGAFTGPNFSCQVSTMNDLADLAKLRAELNAAVGG